MCQQEQEVHHGIIYPPTMLVPSSARFHPHTLHIPPSLERPNKACSSSPGALEPWPLPGMHRNHPGPPPRPFRIQSQRLYPRYRSYCQRLRFHRRMLRIRLLPLDHRWRRIPEVSAHTARKENSDTCMKIGRESLGRTFGQQPALRTQNGGQSYNIRQHGTICRCGCCTCCWP